MITNEKINEKIELKKKEIDEFRKKRYNLAMMLDQIDIKLIELDAEIKLLNELLTEKEETINGKPWTNL